MTELLKSTTFTVDGQSYSTSQMSAVDGRKVFLRLVKAVAPALDKLDFSKSTDADQREQSMLKAAASVLASLDEELLELLCEEFGSRTVHVINPTKTPQMDRVYFGPHFAGRYVQMTKWLLECCKANGLLSFLPGK